MWSFFIHNSKFAYLFLIALIGVGTYSLLSIPRESSPEVIIPVGIVSTVLPGAPATDVETLITNEIERGLSSLENVSSLTSVSREGVSSVTVEFNASADLNESIADLKDAVDTIAPELPDDANEPRVLEVNFVDQPILTVTISADVTDQEFTALARDLETELEQLDGVSRAETSGVREREVTVVVDQASLLLYGISLTEITSALRNANISLPIGQIESNGVSYSVAFEGDIPNPEFIPNIGITTRGGQPVYLRDVAVVVDGLSDPTRLSRFSLEGSPSNQSISFDIYKQSGGDVTAIARTVNTRLDELQLENELLSSYTVRTILDAGADIEEDLFRLSFSGFQTVVLVVLLLVVAIGWREGLIAGVAIPLSFLFGFIGLYFSGNTINFLSLFSLILGVGILVDSAIVMVEGINRRMKEDETVDKRTAAIETIREFSSPLISGTLTTVSMFVGLFIVSGVIGQFIKSIPFTIIFLLIASLFVALAIVPLLASVFLKRRSTTKLEKWQNENAHKLEEWYRVKLRGILGNKSKERRFMWGIRIALVLALLLPAFGFVKVVFFEQGDVDFIIVEVEAPEGTTKEVTDIAVRRVEEVLYTVDEIESFGITVGSGSQFGGGGSGEKLANIFVSLKEDRTKDSTAIVEDLRADLAPIRDAKVTVNQPSDGPPTGAAVVIKYLGDDLTSLTDYANQTAELLKTIPNTTNVLTSNNANNTEFVLTLDRAKATSLGLNPFTISQIARTAVFGSEATALTTLTDDIPVVVKLNLDSQANVATDATNVATIDALTRIDIPTANGTVPLSSLVTVSLRESSTVINHEDQKRVVSITADVTSEGNAREIQAEAIALIEAELRLPNDIELSTGGGEADESNQAFIEMLLALVVGIILMIGILTLQFNSYLHTKYVLSVLPYSLIGIMGGLAITNNPLSFPSIMGFIALSGIVVNNSILLIDMMNKIRMKDPTKDITEVVIDAAANRLRPILLTTLTTVFGMIPLTYAGDLWSPLAYAVIFGLIFCVCITLLLIPIAYNRKPGTVER